ncbi:MAG: HAMP domain-containing sensor histidine kinase [Chloroflexi bacterium]|nr:HAMP domain-containing sensor histidine kinase [Chloroflexota bacterium]MCY4247905.1 HAMP domain-containing sensor histidine kinase [Chloroflexota bacterium]
MARKLAFSLRLRLLTSYLALLMITLSVIAMALLLLIGGRRAPHAPTYERLAALTQGLNYLDFIAHLPFGRDRLQAQVYELLDVFAQTRAVRTLHIGVTREGPIMLYDSAGKYTPGARIQLRGEVYHNEQLAKVLGRGSEQLFGSFVDPDGGEWLYAGVMFGQQRGFGGRIAGNDLWLLAEPQPTVSLHETLAVFGNALAPPLLQAGIAGILFALLLAALISRTIAQPLQRVAKAATGVARGDDSVNVPVSGPPELRSLAESFNHMTAEVRAANAAQRDFLSNVSHDLKTPLTSIQGYAQAIVDGAADDPQAAAQIIYEEASRLNRMVVELTHLEQLQAGKLSMQGERIDMARLCEGVVNSLQVVAAQGHIQLTTDLSPVPDILGDGDRLAQVLTNLVSNALKFTPAGGVVRVAVARSGGGAKVTVRDSGVGIARGDLPRIFERFYQADKARGPQRGNGLGLAIAQEIVEAHEGRLSAESGGEGCGAEFVVWLPEVDAV